MGQLSALSRLIEELARLPGIGEKTATRLAFFVLRSERSYTDALMAAIRCVKDETRQCSICFSLTERDPCDICDDPRRPSDVICVVEDHADVMAVERVGDFRGRYHVLQGTLSPLDGVGPDQLTLRELEGRLGPEQVREVIVATNPTADGEATALYVAKLLKPHGVRVTRIAHGLPAGADIEYADSVTVGRALEGRREM